MYRDYQSGALDQGAATREKRRLRAAYEQAAGSAEVSRKLREEWQEGLRVSQEFLSLIHI